MATKSSDPLSHGELLLGIETTRAHMSGTIETIEERLSPGHVREQVVEQLHQAKAQIAAELQEIKGEVKTQISQEVRELQQGIKNEFDEAKVAVRAATIGKVEDMLKGASNTISDAGTSVVDTIRANPIPVALIGVGVVWLLFGRRRADDGQRSQRAPSKARELTHDAAIKVREATESAAGTVREMAHDAREAAGDYAHKAGEAASELATQGRKSASYVEHRFEDAMRDNPLAVGAGAFALGTAIGLLIPSTRKEDELMGDMRDRLVARAEHAAQEAVGAAEHKVTEALEGLTPPVSSPSNGMSAPRPKQPERRPSI